MGVLETKVAVVTGAGRGIGRATAIRLAAEGARIIVADYGGAMSRIQDSASGPAEATAAEIRAAGGEAIIAVDDISRMVGAERVVAQAMDHFGRIDAMICAAGLFAQAPIWQVDEESWDDVVNSHLRGHFCCTRAAAPHMMKAHDGRFVYFSSAAALTAAAEHPAYSAAKAAILALTRSNAQALRPYGVTVNCVLPGGATRMTDAIYAQAGILTDSLIDGTAVTQDGSQLAAGVGLRSDQAAGTWRDPANVAPFIAYLCSDRAAELTGQCFATVGYQVSVIEERKYGRTVRGEAPWSVSALADRIEAELLPGLALRNYSWPPD